MTPAEGGRYCSVCEKTVKDFTGAPLLSNEKEESGKHVCGSFDATQLYKPFGDRRDVLIGYYQGLKKKNSSRKILLMLVTLLLFLSGCRSRRLSGAYAYGWDYKGQDAAVDTIPEKQPQIK